MSAHELLTTRDCTAYGCLDDATGADGLCDRHRDDGIRPEVTEWTRESILEAVRAWAAAEGRPPSSSQWQKAQRGYPTYTTCMRFFVGWRDMIETAGLDYSLVQARRAYERTAAAVASAATDEGPKPEEPGAAPAGDGRKIRKRGVYWTPERITEAMQEWQRRHGRAPTVREWQRSGPAHPQADTVLERFGSWNAAIVAAGLTPRHAGTGAVVVEGSLVDLAGRVDELSARRTSLIAELDAVEAQLREAVETCQDALAGHLVREAA